MDRETLDELRSRRAVGGIWVDNELTGGPYVTVSASERDALFAYIDMLERTALETQKFVSYCAFCGEPKGCHLDICPQADPHRHHIVVDGPVLDRG